MVCIPFISSFVQFFFLVAPNEACRPSLVKSFSMIFVFKFFFSVRMLLISLEFDARSGLLAIH